MVQSNPKRQAFVLKPWIVMSILGCVLTLTTSIYLSALNTTINDSKDHHNNPGVYGPMSADFDWCERNHHYSPYLAEPFNSLTSLTYCMVGIFAYFYHRKYLEMRLILICVAIFVIGVGSTLFHGTLQYSMQLLDELPMLYLVVTASWGLYERNDLEGSMKGKLRAAFIFFVCAVSSALIAFTDKDDPLHDAGRLIMIVSFSISLVYVFYGASIAIGEHQELIGKDEYNSMAELFSYGFLTMVVALISWIVDNMMCDALYSLPIYPQLHAFGWHFGTAAAVYFMILALYVHRLGMKSYKYELDYLYYIIPVVKT